ncbi:MAG TPA: glycosyltransferase [Rhizomicrobium sp.]|nr:glycosyltransferase [Rhizomicrobium sp.]
MAEPDDRSDAELKAAARAFVQRFETDRAAAVAQFQKLPPKQNRAGKFLQALNALSRYDIVVGLTDAIGLDDETSDLVVTERARALILLGAADQAESLLVGMATGRRGDYAYRFNAGRLMSDAGRPQRALGFYQDAFRAKPTAAAAERIFLAHLALGQYAQAAQALQPVMRLGSLPEQLVDDVALLLRRIAPGKLDADLAFALASLPEARNEDVIAALLPHLAAGDLLDCMKLAIESGALASGGWTGETLRPVLPYLERRGRLDLALAVREQCVGAPKDVRAEFSRLLADATPERRAAYFTPVLSGFAEPSGDYLERAKRFSKSFDAEDGLSMLAQIPGLIAAADFDAFYDREKRRIGRLATFVRDRLGARADPPVAALIARIARARMGGFWSDPALGDLADAIAMARRMDRAPDDSRLGMLREGCFRWREDRRSYSGVKGLSDDALFCSAALGYFADMAAHRSALAVPVGRDLSERLARKPSRGGGETAPADALTRFVMDRERPRLPANVDYDGFCWWYLTELAVARHVPPACFDPEIAGHLNAPEENETDLADFGVPRTKFLSLFRRRRDANRGTYDLANIVDRCLFVFELIRSELARDAQLLAFLDPFLGRETVLTMALGELAPARRNGPGLLEAARGIARPAIMTRDPEAPCDVLLVGHASKNTGLGRNYRMLMQALELTGSRVVGLDFDSRADVANARLADFARSARGVPVAVFAVNAHDVPEIFVKDRRGVLIDCHCAGFFLWEASRPAAMQELGVRLMDEVWAPTRYVADIYSPFAETHVVGKGLFRGDEEFLNAPRRAPERETFRFVTVFDFDSSIERKNPLAVALAFQEAFGGQEKVELVIKTSNVNPQHWSNAWSHWETLISHTLGDSRIRIVRERYSDEQMAALIGDADCVVSLHRSEGFGYLISDAMAFGTPVIATDYSGNADFASALTAFPAPYVLVPVPDGAVRWRCEGAVWADPDVSAAARQMRAVFDDRPEARARAERARANIAAKYSMAAFADALSARLSAIRAGAAGGVVARPGTV